jgi:hypothetical protein
MSFDEGFHLGMTSDDDFRAKFAALMTYHELSFSALCAQAGVDQNVAQTAIELGTYGLQQHSTTLQRLLSPLGMDLSWLLNAPSEYAQSIEDKRLELFELVFEFAIRNEIPRSHRKPLIKRVMQKLDSAPANSLNIAARVGLPRTMSDVAYIYQDLLREGGLE